MKKNMLFILGMMMNMSNAVDRTFGEQHPSNTDDEHNVIAQYQANAPENQQDGCNANPRDTQDTLRDKKKQIHLTDPSIDLEVQGEKEFNKVLRGGSAVPQQQYNLSTFAPKNNTGRENNTNNAE